MTHARRTMGRRPSARARAILTTLAALACAACGSHPAPSGDDAATGGGGSAASTTGSPASAPARAPAVTISAYGAGSTTFIDGAEPGSGRSFVVVEVTLRNASAPGPVPAGDVYWSVTTAAGLSITSSAATALLSAGCSGDTSVVPGGEIRCAVAFAVPEDDSARAIVYDDRLGDAATAPISSAPPPAGDACATLAASANLDDNACLDCLASTTVCSAERGELAAQRADGETCPSAPTACASCESVVLADQCSCSDTCLGGCLPAFDALYQCLLAQCGPLCQ